MHVIRLSVKLGGLLLVLCACAGDHQSASKAQSRATPVAYQPDARGIGIAAYNKRIDFGRTDHSVIPAMNKLVGSPHNASQNCRHREGAGKKMLIWPDGMAIVFARGEFVGWKRIKTGAQAGQSC